MPDVTVMENEDTEPTTAEQSAHEAAVAEGATAVQAAVAEEAAAEAQAAAELALDAAKANIETAEGVAEAVAQAQGDAAKASVSAEMVHEALLAQTRAIEELTTELRASRKAASDVSQSKPRSRPSDESPGNGGTRWVRR